MIPDDLGLEAGVHFLVLLGPFPPSPLVKSLNLMRRN
jgi:hypothetical protein